jgi:hypothetical protein
MKNHSTTREKMGCGIFLCLEKQINTGKSYLDKENTKIEFVMMGDMMGRVVQSSLSVKMTIKCLIR